jgi:hypothetical protein
MHASCAVLGLYFQAYLSACKGDSEVAMGIEMKGLDVEIMLIIPG